MAGPLLETKLFVPRLRRAAVARPRLSEQLRLGSEVKLTLVSAPAGFGKTTVLAQWLASRAAPERPVAWLSLEEDDSQPGSFWTYLSTALDRAIPGVGADALALLASPQPNVQAALATIVNDLAAEPTDVDLVLDDYHLVDGPDIGAGITFLLEHLPPNVRLVISTRADPALPLARLRARGDLLEIRASDLRFTSKEVASYLNDVSGLDLNGQEVAVLDGRTEGWIAALQLAALSMKGREDVRGFIAGFAGDDRYIVDYLLEEVLVRQPQRVRDFLVSTCILDRLTGRLCDAVTGHPGGKAMLENLERANLFVVPLDEGHHWYRYHHLFAEVLHTYLVDERPDEVSALHSRASRWYEEQGETPSAVRHALAAGDVSHAAALVELAIPVLRRTRQDAIIRGWVDVIPDDVVRVRPVLAALFAGTLMSAGEFDDVEHRLDDVEQWLTTADDAAGTETAAATQAVVVDRNQVARLPGMVQMYRAALALSRGDVPGTLRHAQLAVDRAADDDDLTRAGASALSGLASWGVGDLDAAHRAYTGCVEGMRRVGHIADILGCSITLADIRLTQGRLRDAQATYDRALLLAADHSGTALPGGTLPGAVLPGTVLPGTADMYVGLSHVAFERDDLDAATAHLLRSHELGERAGLPQNPHRWRIAMARVQEARGDLAAAVAVLDEAEAVYTADFAPNVRPVHSVRARMLAKHGYVDEAFAWAMEHRLSPDDELSYRHEHEHVTLARVLLAGHTADGTDLRPAAALLQRLLTAAEAGGRTGTVIEVLILQALTQHANGGTADALVPLRRALGLAEPEGYVRVFTGEESPMGVLVNGVGAGPHQTAYVRRIANACRDTARSDGPAERSEHGARSRAPGMIEPLSERELHVLRLLSSDLDGPGIARHLSVSIHTVRSHTKSIYAKLGVNSRRAAVRRGDDLGLVNRTPRR
jgi:LuxR family maltose regulon positive regulatory protein